MNVSVTVPSTLPIIFNADGTNTFADNWTIENVSALAGIHVTNVHLNGDGTGWKVVKDSETVKTQTVNGKSVKFFVGVMELCGLCNQAMVLRARQEQQALERTISVFHPEGRKLLTLPLREVRLQRQLLLQKHFP